KINYEKEDTLQNLIGSLKKNYPQCRYIFMNNKGRIILSKTVDKTQRHLTYYDFEQDHDINYINSETNKIGLLSSISFSRRLEKLRRIIFEQSRDRDSKLSLILKGLVQVDLTMELIGLYGK